MDRAFTVLEDMKSDDKFAPDEILYNSILDGWRDRHRRGAWGCLKGCVAHRSRCRRPPAPPCRSRCRRPPSRAGGGAGGAGKGGAGEGGGEDERACEGLCGDMNWGGDTIKDYTKRENTGQSPK